MGVAEKKKQTNCMKLLWDVFSKNAV